MLEDHFAGEVAARYDATLGPKGTPEELDPTVDLVAQRAVSHHFVADDSDARAVRTPFRYVWPSELDLMARLAGLRLRHRWAGWDRAPFTDDSRSHVSVWEKPADPGAVR